MNRVNKLFSKTDNELLEVFKDEYRKSWDLLSMKYNINDKLDNWITNIEIKSSDDKDPYLSVTLFNSKIVYFDLNRSKYWYNKGWKNYYKGGLEGYIRYLAYHELCHLIQYILKPSDINGPNKGHTKLYTEIMNKYRSKYTNNEFIVLNDGACNFGDLSHEV